MKIFRRILIAIQFLTILPLAHKATVEPEEYGRSMAYFSLAGLFIGLVLSCVYAIIAELTSPLLTAVIVVGVWIWFTGMLHLEGFADAVDGFSSGPDKEKILAVMKDVHCGSKGVAALVFLIILKVVLLGEISASIKFSCLILTPAISKWAMVCAAYFCDYARKTHGFGKAFVDNVGIRELLISSGILIIAGFVLLQLRFFILITVPLGITVISIIYFRRKIHGVTGDVLGTLNEIVEIASLSAFLFLR